MTRLEKYIEYQRYNRQSGNTTLMLDGVRYDKPAIILFADKNSVRRAYDVAKAKYCRELTIHQPNKLGHIEFKTIEFLNYNDLRRYNVPIMIDHFAMNVLFQEHQDEMDKRYSGEGK